jgi:hypothetical protein
MQRRLLLAFVWPVVLFLIGLARIVWYALRYLTADIRRFLLLGGVLLAVRTTDLSALHLAPQIEVQPHTIMAAGALGVLLVLVQGFLCPWSRNLRRRLGGW